MKMNERAKHEIQHGKFLAEGDTETLWGWGTPAGRIRAQRRAELIKNGAQLSESCHVLEIGCGTGMFTEMFSQTGCSIIAVDISDNLLNKAKLRNLPKEKVVFLNKRFEECEENGPFDAVIGSSVLHHLELNEAIPKIYQLLKPNGIMSFAEPNMMNPQIFIERKLRKFFPYISPDETAFIRWTFAKELQRFGFQRINITPFDWLHPSIPKKLIKVVSSVGRTLERLPLLQEFSGSLHIKAVKI